MMAQEPKPVEMCYRDVFVQGVLLSRAGEWCQWRELYDNAGLLDTGRSRYFINGQQVSPAVFKEARDKQ